MRWLTGWLVIILLVTCLFAVLEHLGAFDPPALHSYVVVRFNPGHDGLLRPTLMGGENPTLVATQVIAYSYRNVPNSDCWMFTFPGGVDTICGIVHVKDSGPWSAGGAQ